VTPSKASDPQEGVDPRTNSGIDRVFQPWEYQPQKPNQTGPSGFCSLFKLTPASF
jgi:hypothetical protein